MIEILERGDCCGCTACVNACPVQCIVMRKDREGFDYPLADSYKCIGCGKCEEVCPVISPMPERKPLAVLGGRCGEYVARSASGGIFPYLAEKVTGLGGLVYGAAFEADMSVSHREAKDMNEVECFRGPKYVQSELYAVFDDVRENLAEGRSVLFSGTPCQVAGLKNYIGRDDAGLWTVDFACHGVPPPALWKRYAGSLEKRYGAELSGVSFRDKERSWMHYDVVYEFRKDGEHCRTVRTKYMEDPYMALFVQNMTLRPSCYNCPVRCGRSGSDLTLGDLWNVRNCLPELDDDAGTGLVLVNTERGRQLLEGLALHEIDHGAAVGNNGGFAVHSAVPERREEFFAGLDSAHCLHGYMSGFVKEESWARRAEKSLRRLAGLLKRRIMG